MIRLKDIVNSIIKEGPENILDHDWLDSTCIGPFLIFKDDANVVHYILSIKDSDVIVFDDESPQKHTDIETHGGLVNILRKDFLIDVGRNDYKKAIHGRLWNIDNKYYAATWNTTSEIKSFGLSDFMDSLKDMMESELSTRTTDLFINTFPTNATRNYNSGKVTGEYIPFRFFKQKAESSKKNDELTTKQRDFERQLHIMSPEVRHQFLKAKGIPTKTGGMPDWQKKSMMGVDENI
jgi:hypothetical protein